jgi:hypothetical protein
MKERKKERKKEIKEIKKHQYYEQSNSRRST